jgi:hypothetical protein
LASAAAGFWAKILPSQITASVGGKCLDSSTPHPERGQTEVKVDKFYCLALIAMLCDELFKEFIFSDNALLPKMNKMNKRD